MEEVSREDQVGIAVAMAAKLLESTGRGKAINLLRGIVNGTREDIRHKEELFHRAPASSKPQYHGCYPGGLILHSVRVTELLLSFAAFFKQDIPEWELIFAGLFHDLGKIGLPGSPYYLDMGDGTYKYNQDIDMPHQMLSLWWLNSYGVHVTPRVFKAIAYHNGLYTPMGQEISSGKEGPLLLMLHWADMWDARMFVEDDWKTESA